MSVQCAVSKSLKENLHWQFGAHKHKAELAIGLHDVILKFLNLQNLFVF